MLDLSDNLNYGVSWGALSPLQGMASRTLLAWVNFDAYSAAHLGVIAYPLYGTGGNEYWDFFHSHTLGVIVTEVGWSGGVGGWSIARPATGGWHHIGITYSNTSTTNDPVMYLDGASVTVTERLTPSGTYSAGTTTITTVGARSSGTEYPMDGKIASLCIYNRIMGAAEIADAYNSRLAIPSWYGLVFAPNLSGAAGLQTFDGATLAAGNTIADQVNGSLGVPNGSPVGVADTYLEYR